MARSHFQQSLDVLTCVYQNEQNKHEICRKAAVEQGSYSQIISSLCEWELLEKQWHSAPQITEKGKRVLSYYHNYSEALRVEPTPHIQIEDYY